MQHLQAWGQQIFGVMTLYFFLSLLNLGASPNVAAFLAHGMEDLFYEHLRLDLSFSWAE